MSLGSSFHIVHLPDRPQDKVDGPKGTCVICHEEGATQGCGNPHSKELLHLVCLEQWIWCAGKSNKRCVCCRKSQCFADLWAKYERIQVGAECPRWGNEQGEAQSQAFGARTCSSLSCALSL